MNCNGGSIRWYGGPNLQNCKPSFKVGTLNVVFTSKGLTPLALARSVDKMDLYWVYTQDMYGFLGFSLYPILRLALVGYCACIRDLGVLHMNHILLLLLFILESVESIRYNFYRNVCGFNPMSFVQISHVKLLLFFLYNGMFVWKFSQKVCYTADFRMLHHVVELWCSTGALKLFLHFLGVKVSRKFPLPLRHSSCSWKVFCTC